MHIITLAFNRPDFIELQLNSLKKWVKDFTFTVYDNAPNDSIKDECERLGIKCVPIKVFGDDPSVTVGVSLNKLWSLLDKRGKVLYIDHDMFLINKLPKFNCDMAFVPQVKKDYTYPWTGLMYFNFDKMINPEQMKWQVDYSLKETDVGGMNHYYLEFYKPKVTELEMWTLIEDNKFSFNGADCEFKPDHDILKATAQSFDFPKPYSFDMFRVTDKPFFIFHYKSASNYPAFYTPDYNRLKTQALCKLLMS